MNVKSQRNFAITVAVLLLLSSFYFLFRSLDLSGDVKSVSLERENALSENLSLTKSLVETKGMLENVTVKNSQLTEILDETREHLIEKEKELASLRQSLKSLTTYKKKSSDLEVIKRDLEQKILELNNSVATLKQQIDGLEQQVTVANSGKETTESKLNDLLTRPFSDNYRTEAQRGRKNILTVIARRTNRLNISMDVPAHLQQAISFTITTPDGKTLSSAQDLSREVRIIDSDASFVIDNGFITGAEQTMKRVQLIYSPAKKLKKGIYKYQLFTGSKYLGSAQVNLK